MERSLRQIDPAVHLTAEATLDALGKTITREKIEQVLKPLGIVTCRRRKLTFVLVVLLCIAMCLYTKEEDGFNRRGFRSDSPNCCLHRFLRLRYTTFRSAQDACDTAQEES